MPSVNWRQAIMPWAVFLSNDIVAEGGNNTPNDTVTDPFVTRSTSTDVNPGVTPVAYVDLNEGLLDVTPPMGSDDVDSDDIALIGHHKKVFHFLI